MTNRLSLRLPLRLAAGLVVLAAVGGCGKSYSPTTPVVLDAITISSIVPANGSTLHPGSVVHFTATVSYTLASAATGTVSLVYQDQNGKILNPSTQVSQNVTSGTAMATLSDTFTIPATGVTTLFVFFPLLPTGASGTNVAVTATYPVG